MIVHSEIVLEQMAREHFAYEVERLTRLLPIQAHVAPFVHPIITQSLLESFLLHLRLLTDFVVLPAKPRHDLDVAAEHYYGGFWPNQPKALFGTDRAEHRANVAAMDRRLAHISVQRVSTEQFVWSRAVAVWLPILVSALKTFISDLPPERRAWFVDSEALLNAAPCLRTHEDRDE